MKGNLFFDEICVKRRNCILHSYPMSCFTRCCSKKSVENTDEQTRLFNENHFSSGMDLPLHPQTIYPSTILDKQLTVGQFGQPQRMNKALHPL